MRIPSFLLAVLLIILGSRSAGQELPMVHCVDRDAAAHIVARQESAPGHLGLERARIAMRIHHGRRKPLKIFIGSFPTVYARICWCSQQAMTVLATDGRIQAVVEARTPYLLRPLLTVEMHRITDSAPICTDHSVTQARN